MTDMPTVKFIAGQMRECDVWRNCSEVELDNAMEGMEKLVMNRLYDLSVPKHLPDNERLKFCFA